MSTETEPDPELTAPPDRPDDHRHLDRALARSIAWTGIAKVASQALAWASTLVVARLLTPGDYGLYGMATVFMWAIRALSEFGLGAAIIRQRDLTEAQIQQINSVCVLFGLASTALVLAAAGPLSVFFAAPALYEVVVVTSLSFFISSFYTVPGSLLQRDLRFKRLAASDAFHAAASAGFTLAAALAGLGLWSLVFGNLLASLANTIFVVASRPTGFAIPHAKSIAGATRMGGELIVARFSWYAMFNGDFVVAGRVLGAAPLGSYSFAWTLARLPVEKISLLVTRVSLPFFASVQANKETLRRYVMGMTRGLALVTFPAAIGIGLVAVELVEVVLGPKWSAAILPLRILAIVAPIQSVATLFPQITPVIGRTRFGMYHGVISTIVMIAAFAVGSLWGIGGIAGAWVLVYPLILLPLLLVVLRGIEATPAAYFGALAPSLISSAIMSAGVLGLRAVLPGAWPGALRLILLITTGALIYGAAIWLLFREQVAATFRFLRTARSTR